jgi:hypothetical protein
MKSRVYFFQAGEGGPIKIGVTAGSVTRRRDNLQIGAAEEIRSLGSYSGDRAAEAALHQRFAASRVRGEWFKPTDELLGLIAELAEPEAGRRVRVTHDHPIAKWRRDNCVTLNELAGRVGISNAALSRYETGKRKPTPKHLQPLYKATGIPPRELRPDIAKLLGL